MLALEDRLSLLHKQAGLLKEQLEQVLAADAVGSGASTPAQAAAETTSATSTPPTASSEARTSSTVAATAATLATSKPRSISDLLADWRVIGGALGGLLIAGFAYTLGRRRPAATEAAVLPSRVQQAKPGQQQTPAHQRTQEFQAALMIPEAERTAEWRRTSQILNADETMEFSKPPTTSNLPVPEPTAAKPAASSVGNTREFHITQQFQPTTERTVALSTAEEIVQQARTHYMEDGDVFRAIDLLEMSVSVRTDSTRPWQALFAIYRRENMSERSAPRARYRQAFGEDANGLPSRVWDTRGFEQSAVFRGCQRGPVPTDLLERWLGVPLDHRTLLANEMHDQLMETLPGSARKRKRVAGE
jgi:hypothetical protein